MVSDRTICHVDMDAFYVSVELRRRPDLAGQPVVVGGTGRRGVVAAASYEARRFGVFSAIPSSVARRRCPHAVFLPGDHELYASVSAQVHEIFARYTPLVEPLALDEAFLDVSGGLRLFGEGVEIGHRIRDDILTELGLTCSVGVATNKFVAKVASVAAKPQVSTHRIAPGKGVVEVRPGDETAFLHPLPITRVWGVGPKTQERLQRFGVATVGDLAGLDRRVVAASLGEAQATHLCLLSQGVDDRPVMSRRDPKSIGHEETYPVDLTSHAALHHELVRLADAMASRLRGEHLAARTFTLKVRFAGFRTITRSLTLAHATDDQAEIIGAVAPILDRIDVSGGVRLLGVTGTKFGAAHRQLGLFDAPDDTPRTNEMIDQIRAKFGASAIGPASSIRSGAIATVRRGAQQWGPDHPGINSPPTN